MRTAKRRLFLTEDRTRVVPEGDAAAATLYAGPGDFIPDGAVEKFGLKVGVDLEPAEPEAKAAEQAPNKAIKLGGNK